MGTSFAILFKVCCEKMSIDEELLRKAKQVEFPYSQQDDRHVPKKKVLELVKVLSGFYTRYGEYGSWFRECDICYIKSGLVMLSSESDGGD